MSFKRSRADFEADLQAQQSPYVLFGTPLPPLDPEVRDDGSYVPVWKQEVRDERGRKRLHGAFTGGFSAGYFNTVGSKEGWTPSTFVSSRTNRRKDDAKTAQQRIEDFMDEEDLADAAEAEKLQTAKGFAGLGSMENDGFVRRGGLADLFRAEGETMGVKLLRRMGWKDGQGIGPKVRRIARLDLDGKTSATHDHGDTHLFAPDNVPMIAFIRKQDRKGLGYAGEARLTPMSNATKAEAGESSDEEARHEPFRRPNATQKTSKSSKGGIGIGILNDTGSDDEDPYDIGPRISYNRTIGGDKKKKKKKAVTTTTINPAVRSAPVFIPRKNALAKAGKNLRKCHDGRLPLDGFVFGTQTDSLSSEINSAGKYPPPTIPEGWKPSKQRKDAQEDPNYVSTADAAKASKLDPTSRAALLGEAQLPGKSVFDFLSPSARDRLASATGKSNLPPALSEIPEGYALTEAERQQEILRQVPELDKTTALAALARGVGGTGPYSEDERKRARYRQYLEHSGGLREQAPTRPAGLKPEDWLRELREFHSCARIFKPMTGLMAARFTTSSTLLPAQNPAGGESAVAKPPPAKPKDPAEEAAALGMYGAMTRSVTDFFPARLLCKRFNVPAPAHVQPDGPVESRSNPISTPYSSVTADAAVTIDDLIREAQAASERVETQPEKQETGAEVKPEINEAVEGKRAEEDVLRAIFGDSSDEEEG
ncbi:DUF1604-domain-containing protein [Xylariomycetidae sp. FL0641]|nr:DUF1604-domain-containing protein [Xylariomycetidae sp. FL0641]